ncbi:hypothetical protein [Bryobacter aggregatus]|uniref:hypothetical protein n=1 Tax=Bryobacter aggregatus TaxID=360054 RepID=UPI0012BADB83|nr:hypothetical protein [Bryobacter aggregatus]
MSLLYPVSVFVAIACAATEVLAQSDSSAFSKLPLWPPNGIVSGALSEKYVFRDPNTAEVVITIPEDSSFPSGPRSIIRWRLQNQVEPTVISRINPKADHVYQYSYSVTNGAYARQSINTWILLIPKPDQLIEPSHLTWGKIRLRDAAMEQAAHPMAPASDGAYWGSDKEKVGSVAIGPGMTEGDFTLEAKFLPGFTTAYFVGGEPLATASPLPLEVAQQLVPVMKMREIWRSSLVIGPRFAPEASMKEIITDYLIGLKALAESGRIPAVSPFLLRARAQLQKCIEVQTIVTSCVTSAVATMKSVANAPLEKEVASALEIVAAARK